MRRLLTFLLVLLISGSVGYIRYQARHMQHDEATRLCACMDRAHILGRERTDFIIRYRAALLNDFSVDLVVVTVPGRVDIATEAVREFEAAKVGDFGGRGRGLLLLVAPDSNAVRLEVSQALEGIYTDSFVAYVQQRQMAPFFQNKRVGDGILATIELLYSRAVDADKHQAFDPRALEGVSAGGGAQMAANIGTGYDGSSFRQQTGEVSASGSPQQVMAAYLGAMRQRDARPDLDIYSAASRRMMAQWTVTPAQMDNIAATYAGCGTPELRPTADSDHVVLRYSIPERTCSPWFFVRESGAWRLDLTMMQRALRFNNRNQWHFQPGVKHEYEAAFSDWTFNENGFPNR